MTLVEVASCVDVHDEGAQAVSTAGDCTVAEPLRRESEDGGQ